MAKQDAYVYTQNRELSWLKFNERVLEEAGDPRLFRCWSALSLPPSFTSNLDEFYMIRCGSLYDISILDDDYIDSKSGHGCV